MSTHRIEIDDVCDDGDPLRAPKGVILGVLIGVALWLVMMLVWAPAWLVVPFGIAAVALGTWCAVRCAAAFIDEL